MAMSDELNRLSISQIQHGADPFYAYLDRKQRLEDERRGIERTIQLHGIDAASRLAEARALEEMRLKGAAESQDRLFANEKSRDKEKETRDQQATINRKAAEFRVPVTNRDGTRRSDEDILADIDARGASTAKSLISQKEALNNQLNDLYKAPEFRLIQTQAMQQVLSDPTLLSSLDKSTQKLISAVRSPQDFGQLLSKLRTGFFGGKKQNADADALQGAFEARKNDLTAYSNDQNVKQFAVLSRNNLEQQKRIDETLGRITPLLSPDASANLYPVSVAQNPKTDPFGLSLPSGAPAATPAPAQAAPRPASNLIPLPPPNDGDVFNTNTRGPLRNAAAFMANQYANPIVDAVSGAGRAVNWLADKAIAGWTGDSPLNPPTAELKRPMSRSLENPAANQAKLSGHFGTDDLSWTPEDTQAVTALATSKGIPSVQLQSLFNSAMKGDSAAARQFMTWRDEARRIKALSSVPVPDGAYPPMDMPDPRAASLAPLQY